MNTQLEQQCAEILVSHLVEKFYLPIQVCGVYVATNGKCTFHFRVVPPSNVGVDIYDTWLESLPSRYGRGVGVEMDWVSGEGDVDEFQVDGDVWTALRHGFQIVRKWFLQRETKPSVLLARSLRERC